MKFRIFIYGGTDGGAPQVGLVLSHIYGTQPHLITSHSRSLPIGVSMDPFIETSSRGYDVGGQGLPEAWIHGTLFAWVTVRCIYRCFAVIMLELVRIRKARSQGMSVGA